MADVIGEVFPFAFIVALSPIPIIAIVLMLLSPDAARASLAYLAGWVAGIAVLLTVFTLLASFIPGNDPDESNPLVGTIQILLGLGLGYLAWRNWQKRPAPGADAELPSWMAAVDTMTAQRALGFGVLLSAANPKNLIIMLPPGLAIGSAELGAGSVAVVIVVFTILASLSVLIPIIAYRVAPSKVVGPLRQAQTWLVQNNATVMTVLLLVLGANAIGNGIGTFS